MKPLTELELRNALDAAGITYADRRTAGGRELHDPAGAVRSVVVLLGESDIPEHASRALRIVLAARKTWLVVPRYRPASQLPVPGMTEDAEAVLFSGDERDALSEYLCTRGFPSGSHSNDVYVIGEGGTPLLTWDHHWDEGIDIGFRSVDDSSELLVALNALGAQMEVYCGSASPE